MHLYLNRRKLIGIPLWQGALLVCITLGFMGSKAEAKGGEQPSAPVFFPASITSETKADQWIGRLVRFDKSKARLAVLTVRGTAEERGRAHGTLLRPEIQKLIKSVRTFLSTNEEAKQDKARYTKCLDGARAMRAYLERDVLVELNACAAAAGVDKTELLLAQLFGDVNRAKGLTTFCSSFAAFGPATKDGKLIVGRNFDYAGHGLEGGVPIILQEIPSGLNAGRPFTTIGYAGILNGWTALNADGLCASNNTLFGGQDSLEGMSTCFLLRKIVERGRTVEDGVKILKDTQRACTTGMLIAGKNIAGKWDACFVEFDHLKLEVVKPENGWVMATNTRQKLSVGVEALNPQANPVCDRFQTMKANLLAHKGALEFAKRGHNPVAATGVYMTINLHCALLDPSAQRFQVAVSPGDGTPAAEHPFRLFQIRTDRVEFIQSKAKE